MAGFELFDPLLVHRRQLDVWLHRFGGERGEIANHVVHQFRVRFDRRRADLLQVVLLGRVHQTTRIFIEHQPLYFAPFRISIW